MRPTVRNIRDVEPVEIPEGKLYPVAQLPGGNVAFVEAVRPSRPHVHEEATEVYLIVSGRGWIELDENRQELEPGTVVLIPTGVGHGYAPYPGGTIELYVVSSPPWREDDEFPRRR